MDSMNKPQDTGNEIWWLIERKPIQDDFMHEIGNRFFDGKDWQESALKAARFPTKEVAQSLCDNLEFLRGDAFPVEHMWMTAPQSKPQMRVSELAQKLSDRAERLMNSPPSDDGEKYRAAGQIEILIELANLLDSLDLQPSPPTECELKDEEISTFWLDWAEEGRRKYPIHDCLIALSKVAAKKARAFGQNEVLKDPERFGLAKLSEDQSWPISTKWMSQEEVFTAGFRKVVIQKVQK